MFLEGGVGQLINGVVGLVACVFDGVGDVLDEVVNLLLVGGRGDGCGADEVDEGLDALDEEGGLVFEIVLWGG